MEKCSVGIMVYNEVDNLDVLLEAITNQVLDGWTIEEIIFVSSGSTDSSDERILSAAQQNHKIKLFKQEQRLGKCSAINLFLKEVKSKICILINADSLPAKDSFQILLSSLGERVGLVGARPVPVNADADLIGFFIGYLWQIHHRIACMKPKIGEMFAFRKEIVTSLPENCAVDEAMMEVLCMRSNYRIVYDSRAIIYIKGAHDIKGCLAQRRRIAYGHIWLYKNYHYLVSTREKKRIIKAMLQEFSLNPKIMLFTYLSVLIESIGRILGLWDYYIKKNHNHHIWNVAKSSKGKIRVN